MGKLDDILTDDFNPWFPGSEYGKDQLEEAKQQIKDLIKELYFTSRGQADVVGKDYGHLFLEKLEEL